MTMTITLAMRPGRGFLLGASGGSYRATSAVDGLRRVFSVITALTPFAPNYAVFVLLRALYGIGMGVLGLVLVGDGKCADTVARPSFWSYAGRISIRLFIGRNFHAVDGAVLGLAVYVPEWDCSSQPLFLYLRCDRQICGMASASFAWACADIPHAGRS